ncbi:MAG: YitT family protein, partial [Eubacteriaceae bacterium]
MKKIKKIPFKRILITALFLFIGSILTAVGLEIFLVPNNIIDGGI